MKEYLKNSLLVIASIIGSGIYALPYVISKFGIFPSLIVSVLFFVIFLKVSLLFLKVIDREKDKTILEFVKNRSKTLYNIFIFLFILTSIFIIGLYILGFSLTFSNIFHTNYEVPLIFALLFFSLILFFGEKTENFEIYLTLIITGLLFIYSVNLIFSSVDIRINPVFNINYLGLFLSTLFFSIINFFFIPELYFLTNGNYDLTKRSYITGFLISFLITMFFSISVVMYFNNVSEFALNNILATPVGYLIGIVAILSFLTCGSCILFVLREILIEDLKINKIFLLFIPIVSFLIAKIIPNFSKIVGIIGKYLMSFMYIIIFWLLLKYLNKKEKIFVFIAMIILFIIILF